MVPNKGGFLINGGFLITNTPDLSIVRRLEETPQPDRAAKASPKSLRFPTRAYQSSLMVVKPQSRSELSVHHQNTPEHQCSFDIASMLWKRAYLLEVVVCTQSEARYQNTNCTRWDAQHFDSRRQCVHRHSLGIISHPFSLFTQCLTKHWLQLLC